MYSSTRTIRSRSTLVATGLVAALVLYDNTAVADPVRYLPDVVGQFEALTVRPDALGFYPGQSPDPTSCKHYQGIVRVDAPDGTPYLYVSRSGNIATLDWMPDAQACGEIIGSDDPGNLLVVRMGSRDTHGERLRSNRIQRNRESMHTPPDTADTTVAYFTFDGTGDWPNYGHPGGMQAVGTVVALALETPYDPTLPEIRVLFFDVSEPESPVVLSHFDPEPGVLAGLVGLTALPDGSYLMVLTGGQNEQLWFYRSLPTGVGTATDLRDPGLDWELLDTWSEAEDEVDLGAEWPSDKGAAHQTLHFLREGGIGGPLYLAAARGKYGFGEDHLDLYRVEFYGSEVKLRFVANRHKISHPALDPSILSPGNNTASFAAASAFYVSPSGELIFYATEHDNDGAVPGDWEIPVPCSTPLPWRCGSVKMGEWRHIDMVRHDSPTLRPSAAVESPTEVPEGTDIDLKGTGVPAITKAWVQLWAGSDFGGRYLVMDYDDRLKDNFEDFKDLEGSNIDAHFGFDNEPSSMRAFAPVGCTIRLNDDDIALDDDTSDPGEYTRTLAGTGRVMIAPRLSQISNDSGSGSIDEELTSAQFFKDCGAYYDAPVTLAWDTDGDGTYETTGATAELSGAFTDGPEVVSVTVRAMHTADGTAGVSTIGINVTNVAPAITSLRLLDGLGQEIGSTVPFALAGLAVRLEGTFADPGQLDWQTAHVAWGDGQDATDGDFDQFRDAYGSGLGAMSDTHVFENAGDYAVTLRVTDDDGGLDDRTVPIHVATAQEAILTVISAIDSMLAGEPLPEVADALEEVRRALDGSQSGSGSNGAIDKLDGASLQAALVKLMAALEGLTASEEAGAGDLTVLKNLLNLVVQQLEAELG